MIIILV